MAVPSINLLQAGLSVASTPDVQQTTVPTSTYQPTSIASKVDQYIQQTQNAAQSLIWPSDLPIYHMQLNIYNYSGLVIPGQFNAAYQGNGLATIKLPLSPALQDSLNIEYNVDALLAEFWSALNQATIGLGNSALQGIANLTGKTANKMLAVLFKGPQYKMYNISWLVAPRNQQESETIRKIIAWINWGTATELHSSQTFFTYPSVFKLSFSAPITEFSGSGRVNNQSKWYNFKPAFCRAFVVNYLPAHHPIIVNGGFPEAMVLTCQFQEIEFWLKKDFANYGAGAGAQ